MAEELVIVIVEVLGDLVTEEEVRILAGEALVDGTGAEIVAGASDLLIGGVESWEEAFAADAEAQVIPKDLSSRNPQQHRRYSFELRTDIYSLFSSSILRSLDRQGDPEGSSDNFGLQDIASRAKEERRQAKLTRCRFHRSCGQDWKSIGTGSRDN